MRKTVYTRRYLSSWYLGVVYRYIYYYYFEMYFLFSASRLVGKSGNMGLSQVVISWENY